MKARINNNVEAWRVLVAVATLILVASASIGYVQNTSKKRVVFLPASSGVLDHMVITPGEAEAVEVLAGTAQDFNATGFDSEGGLVTVSPVWSIVGSSELGSIDNETGLFAGLTAGSVSIMALSNNISASATVNVISNNPSNISVTATPSEINADGNSTAQIFALLLDADENPVANHTLEYTMLSGSGNITIIDSLTNSSGYSVAEYTAATSAGNVIIEVEDTTMPGLTGNVTVQLSGGYEISLVSGWNLMSLPVAS
ncbi:MAG: invasin domain 3-containing protein [Candidatus Altiarchaeota archaeon]